MDETNLFLIEKKHQYFTNLQERKQAIIEKIKAQGKLDRDLEKQILETDKLSILEDLYLPFKSKYHPFGIFFLFTCYSIDKLKDAKRWQERRLRKAFSL